MYWIRGRKKRYLFVIIGVIVTVSYSFSKWMSSSEAKDWDYHDVKRAPCNFEMKFSTEEKPIVGKSV